MKPQFTLYRKFLCILFLGIFPLFIYNVKSAEFAIINGTYYYPSSANAFYCHASPPYANYPSTNWLSPNDFWNGTFYAYYEVIDIPTNEPFAMQLGIFQYYPNAANWDYQNFYETCSLVFPQLQGAGSYAEVNCGSPANWWQHPNGAVDFTRVYDFESVGPVMYSRTAGAYGILYPPDAAAWAVRANYFPCTIRVIVVAVSAGSQFSGWANYINGGGGGGGCTPVQQATPTYAINFATERTNKVVPTTDEYSYNSNMSGAVSGTGSTLLLTPGQDVYFRTKASGDCYLASNIQHLDVPTRPAGTPSYSIDYYNERTNETVSSTVAYSTTPNFTSPVSGTGATVNLTPGQDLYFWVKETSSTFASDVYHLPVPARQQTPAITVDFNNEVTSAVSSAQEWSTSASMTSPTTGTNAALPVSPGTNLYFRTKATASAFLSAVQTLNVPARPATPTYGIDYATEKTSQAVPATDDYSVHSDMSSASAGTGAAITLTPGTDLYFRTRNSASSFRSATQHLTVAARPATPSFHIDYGNETTSETVGGTIEYAATADMTSPASGTGVKLPLTPGEDLYFRVKSTGSSFASQNYQLDVPARPTLEYTGEDTVTSATITMHALLDAGMTGFDLNDLSVTNGIAQNLRAANYFDVIGQNKGDVTVIIPVNKFGGASFASNEVVVYYNKSATGISEENEDGFIVYPNPNGSGILYIRARQVTPYSIEVFSADGNLVKTVLMDKGEEQPLDLKELTKGIYFLKFQTKESHSVVKVVLK